MSVSSTNYEVVLGWLRYCDTGRYICYREYDGCKFVSEIPWDECIHMASSKYREICVTLNTNCNCNTALQHFRNYSKKLAFTLNLQAWLQRSDNLGLRNDTADGEEQRNNEVVKITTVHTLTISQLIQN